MLSTLLGLTVVLAVIASLLAFGQRRQATEARETAAAVQLAASAEAMRARDPRLALQLGVAAHELSPDPAVAVAAAAGILETLTSPQQLGTLLRGHIEGVEAVAFSPDGKILATSGGDGVRLWDLTDPTRPHTLGEPLTDQFLFEQSVAFSPDGRPRSWPRVRNQGRSGIHGPCGDWLFRAVDDRHS